MADAPVIATLVVGLASIITPELLLLRCYVAPRGLANNCPVHNGNNHNMGTMGRGVYDGSAKRSCLYFNARPKGSHSSVQSASCTALACNTTLCRLSLCSLVHIAASSFLQLYNSPQLSAAVNPNSTNHNGSEHKRGWFVEHSHHNLPAVGRVMVRGVKRVHSENICSQDNCEAQARVRQGSARDGSQGDRPQSLNPCLELTLTKVGCHRNTTHHHPPKLNFT